MMPRPPSTWRSSQPMGQGLSTSKTRNQTKTARSSHHCVGSNRKTGNTPTISSKTIPPWSCTPSCRLARSQITTPARKSNAVSPTITAIATSFPHIGTSPATSAQPSRMPGSVPKVPGALGASPLPSPKASHMTGLSPSSLA